MKKTISMLFVALAMAGCSTTAILVPPADVPAAEPAPQADPSWRPYSSGPMQAATPGIQTKGSWGGSAQTAPRAEPVARSPLPDVRQTATTPAPAAGMEERVIPLDPEDRRSARSAASSGGGWESYKGGKPSASGTSPFGQGVESSWAKDYVDPSHHTEFGIFASKAAADGQARMVMPTGEVYSASVVRRNGPCRSLEVTVTADGDLPIIARGPVEVCK